MFNIKLFIDSLGIVHDSFLETPMNLLTNSFLKIGPSKYIVNPHPNSSTSNYNSWGYKSYSSSRNIIDTFQKIYTKFYEGYLYVDYREVYGWKLFRDQFILYSTKIEQKLLNYLFKDYFDDKEE